MKKSTFFVYVDISDVFLETGGAEDFPDLEDAWINYKDACEHASNARLVVQLDTGDEITLAEVGDFGLPAGALQGEGHDPKDER